MFSGREQYAAAVKASNCMFVETALHMCVKVCETPRSEAKFYFTSDWMRLSTEERLKRCLDFMSDEGDMQARPVAVPARRFKSLVAA